MSDSKAYTYPVDPVGSNLEEGYQTHTTSPSWVLTFVRCKYSYSYRVDESINDNPNQNVHGLGMLKDTLPPLVVINDCINVSTSCNKGTFTPSMEATLLQTDVNYLTALAPGDFVLVNMVNWDSKAKDIYDRAHDNKTGSINGINDGFKGIFKIQTVRRITAVIDQATGKRGSVCKITGYAFTEFNNMLYFDPSVALQVQDSPVFSGQISSKWKELISANANQSIQDLLRILISSFIGLGSPKTITPNVEIDAHVLQSPNDKFFMPGIIGKLLAIPEVTVAADIFTYWFGLQKYTNTGSQVTPQAGLNPHIGQEIDGFYYTDQPVAGKALLAPEYWNQVKAWDILNQYINAPLNEMFTCFRVDPFDGTVMPTVVLRQIPFTNEDFYSNGKTRSLSLDMKTGAVSGIIPVTMFMSLPRWKISPTLVISQDIGRDESLRINFVQVFARLLQGTDNGSDYTRESVNHNYQFDINDIQRSGLRPKITSSMFDIFSVGSQASFSSPDWAKIYADAIIGGHLKMNGTIVCAGIQDPIAIGDNLEFEDTVYHIEQVTHTCSIDPSNGIKSFRTTIVVSSGISVYSSAAKGVLYPEMDNTNAYAEREWDYSKSQILPGVSESQAVPYRLPNVDDVSPPLDRPNRLMPQPSQTGLFADSTPTKNTNGQ